MLKYGSQKVVPAEIGGCFRGVYFFRYKGIVLMIEAVNFSEILANFYQTARPNMQKRPPSSYSGP
jgi:hypothetical protein